MEVAITIRDIVKKTIVDAYSVDKWKEVCEDVITKISITEPDISCDETPSISFLQGEKRYKTRPGRYVTKKLGLNGIIEPKHIEQIASKIEKELFGMDNVSLLKGEAITKAYQDEIGGHSCMTGGCCEYTLLYEMNPDKVSLLIMKMGTKHSRGLVFKLDDGRYYLDRVYSNSELLKIQMQNYAKKEGWLYRESFSAGCADVVDSEGSEITSTLQVSNLHFENGHVPYMDSFHTGDVDGDLLTLYTSGMGSIDLDSTDGYIDGGYECEYCGDRITDDAATYSLANGDIICDYCRCNEFFYCENCDELHHNTNSIHVEDEDIYICEYCFNNSNYCACDDCGRVVSETTLVEDSNVDVCNSCIENYYCCLDCGEFFSELEDGLCVECSKETEKEEVN